MPKECPAQIHAASRNPCRERVPRDRDLITQNRTDKTQAVLRTAFCLAHTSLNAAGYIRYSCMQKMKFLLFAD